MNGIYGGYLLPHPPLIVPKVGRGREQDIEKTALAYDTVARRIAKGKPDTVIVITPHAAVYADYIHISPGIAAQGNMARFGAEDVVIKARYDDDFVRRLERKAAHGSLEAGTSGERDPSLDHGTLIPLYFLNQYHRQYKLVRVCASGMPREEQFRFGKMLQDTASNLGRNAVVIASGDLSHKLRRDGPYGYAPEGPKFDLALCAIMRNGDLSALMELDEELCKKAAECAFSPLLMLAGALDGLALQPELHSYEGPFGVGYAVASFAVGLPDACVHLARQAIVSQIRYGYLPAMPEELPEELRVKAGVFVTLRKNGELRGCIGTASPVQENLAEEIRQNALSAALRDPRFPPLQESELEDISISVDVLDPPEKADEDMLDPQQYGLIVTTGYRRGLLLPDIEGIDSVEQQITIACQKAGIRPGEKFTIQRFMVTRHT